MKLRYKIALVVTVLAGVFLWGRRSKTSSHTVPKPATVLPKNDTEQIIVDPVHHSLVIVKPSGKRVLTLPDRQSTIDIRTDGTVNVTSLQWGLEHGFFFGVQGSDAFRIAAGMDGFYYKKLDLGIGLADQIGGHAPIIFAKLSYNFYDNMQVGVTYGNDRLIGGSITVRL